MPNDVINNVVISGPDDEIRRLLAECFLFEKAADGEDSDAFPVPDFERIIPVDCSSAPPADSPWEMYRWFTDRWGTNANAGDGAILEQRMNLLVLEFTTSWDLPEPVFRELGKKFPDLFFHIAAIDCSAGWATIGGVRGQKAFFGGADLPSVFEWVHGRPIKELP